jgi:hypothetical protein
MDGDIAVGSNWVRHTFASWIVTTPMIPLRSTYMYSLYVRYRSRWIDYNYNDYNQEPNEKWGIKSIDPTKKKLHRGGRYDIETRVSTKNAKIQSGRPEAIQSIDENMI